MVRNSQNYPNRDTTDSGFTNFVNQRTQQVQQPIMVQPMSREIAVQNLQERAAQKAAEKNAQKIEAARQKQQDILEGAKFVNTEGNAWDPKGPLTLPQFIEKDKAKWKAEFNTNIKPTLPQRAMMNDDEVEVWFYQTLLEKNPGYGNPTTVGGVNASATENLPIYKKYVDDLTRPISIAGEQTPILSYQERTLRNKVGGRELINRTLGMANPISETFIPSVAGGAILGAPGVALGNETAANVGSFAGSALGLGVGLGAAGNKAILDDLKLIGKVATAPIKASKKTAQLISQFGTRGTRTPENLTQVVSNAAAAPPSASLTQAEKFEIFSNTPTGIKDAWKYDVESAGGFFNPASNPPVLARNSAGEIEITQKFDDGRIITFTPKTNKEWLDMASIVLDLPPEIKQLSDEIVESLISNLSKAYFPYEDPAVAAERYFVGGVASRGVGYMYTPPGTSSNTLAFVQGEYVNPPYGTSEGWLALYQRAANFTAFLSRSAGTEVADNFATLHHELGHIFAPDLFKWAGQTADVKKANAFRQAVIDHTIYRRALQGDPFNPRQIEALNSFDFKTFEDLVAYKIQPDSFTNKNGEGLGTQIHEALAELNAKWALNKVFSNNTGQARRGVLDEVWQIASSTLLTSWNKIKETASGVARSNTIEDRAVQKYSELLDALISGKSTANLAKINAVEKAGLASLFSRVTNAVGRDSQVIAKWLLSVASTSGDDIVTQGDFEALSDAGRLLIDSGESVANIYNATNVVGTKLLGDTLKKIRPLYSQFVDRDYGFLMEEWEFQELVENTISALTQDITKITTNSEKNKFLTLFTSDKTWFTNTVKFTPDEKKILEDSAFIDENGFPVIFWHGGVKFDKYEVDKTSKTGNLLGPGYYTTSNSAAAFTYLPPPRDLKLKEKAQLKSQFIKVPKTKAVRLETVGPVDPQTRNLLNELVYGKAATEEFTELVNSVNAIKANFKSHPELFQEFFKAQPIHSAKKIIEDFNFIRSYRTKYKTLPDVEAIFGTEALTNLYKNFQDIFYDVLATTIVKETKPNTAIWQKAYNYLQDTKSLKNDFVSFASKTYSGTLDKYGSIYNDGFKTAATKALTDTLSDFNRVQAKFNGAVSQQQKDTAQFFKSLTDVKDFLSSFMTHSFKGQDRFAVELAITDSGLLDSVYSFEASLVNEQVVWSLFKSAEQADIYKTASARGGLNDLSVRVLFEYRNLSLFENSFYRYSVDELNDIYEKVGVEALVHYGGIVMGGAPHDVVILVGKDDVINSNIIPLRLKDKPPTIPSLYRRADDQSEFVNPNEVKTQLSSTGEELKQKSEQLLAKANEVLDELEKLKVVPTGRYVDNPSTNTAETTDLINKVADQAYTFNGKTDNLNVIPDSSDAKWNSFFQVDGKPLPALDRNALEEVLNDVSGKFRQGDHFTPDGIKKVAGAARQKIIQLLNDPEYKTIVKNKQEQIDKARKQANARIAKATKDYEDGLINLAEQKEIFNKAAAASARADAITFKPIGLHPLELKLLMQDAKNKLRLGFPPKAVAGEKNIYGFTENDFDKAILKLTGMEVPTAEQAAKQNVPDLLRGLPLFPTQQGVPLTPREVQILSRGFGIEDSVNLLEPKTRLQFLRSLFIQFLNATRTLLVGFFDAGSIMNQGFMLSARMGVFKPLKYFDSLGKSVIASFTAGKYHEQMKALQSDPNFLFLTELTDLFISNIDSGISRAEEDFLGNIFRLIPEIERWSEKFPAAFRIGVKSGLAPVKVVGYGFNSASRFHSFYLNKLRYESLNTFYKELIKSGLPEAEILSKTKDYATFVNRASGRGSLGPVNKLSGELSTFIFAPRWYASRVQVPYEVVRLIGKESIAAAKDPKNIKNMYLTKSIGTSLVASFGIYTSILTLLSLNGFTIHTDWRSPSFGKAEKDELSIDVTFGMGSIFRFIAQAVYGLTTNKAVSKEGYEYQYGETRIKGFTKDLGDFVKSKLSPAGTTALASVTGEDYFGDEVRSRDLLIPGFADIKNLTPITISAIQDAVKNKYDKPEILAIGGLSSIGTGISIYPDRNDLSNEIMGMKYQDLYPWEKDYINKIYYANSQFAPSEYIQAKSEEEIRVFKTASDILNSKTLSTSDKAEKIYRLYDALDITLYALRRAYLGDKEFAETETVSNKLESARNRYFEMLDRLYSSEGAAVYSSEDIELEKEAFLDSVTEEEKMYILASKNNYMRPDGIYDLIKPGKEKMLELIVSKGGQPQNWGDYYYSVAAQMVESNNAREWFTKQGRYQLPQVQDYVDLTEAIATR